LANPSSIRYDLWVVSFAACPIAMKPLALIKVVLLDMGKTSEEGGTELSVDADITEHSFKWDQSSFFLKYTSKLL